MDFKIFNDTRELGEEAALFIARLAAEAIAERGKFTIALSGGSAVKLIAPTLTRAPLREQINWNKWLIFFADERCVPLDHKDSNYLLAREELFFKAAVPEKNIFPINPALPPEESAAAYEMLLKEVFPGQELPRFDLILLGMGEDGHTASLFPGHKLLDEKTGWVKVEPNSPKPPPARLTLTLGVLNNAANVLFLTTGAGKQSILPKVLADTTLPAGRVKPHHGNLSWFVDRDAAAELPGRSSTGQFHHD